MSHTGAAINDTPEKRKPLKKNYGYVFGYIKCKLSMPVLALGGAQSFGPLMVNMVKEVATDVSGGMIERYGHWIADERPEYLTKKLLVFFGKEE